jgi:hypothetical protein
VNERRFCPIFWTKRGKQGVATTYSRRVFPYQRIPFLRIGMSEFERLVGKKVENRKQVERRTILMSGDSGEISGKFRGFARRKNLSPPGRPFGRPFIINII